MGSRVVRIVTTDDGIMQPDLPEGAGFSITAWHNDGTVTVELDERTELKMLIEELKLN